MVNDTISDMLTRIRNANNAKQQLVEIPFTKMTQSLINILESEGYVESSKVLPTRNTILVSLKYVGRKRKSVITTLKRVSKPGTRVYSGAKNLPKVLGNLGIAVVSTSHGVLTDKQARKLNLGGEILCYVW
jgi:small subunit ribosomal protein S8|tara:strand:+ start:4083 stop:4475 length:393 start_codon:yes stop_codon:yes gene_type:complete